MQAVILAAGMGKRLGELTQNNTKCMVKVNGVTLIERLLRQIDAISRCRINRIIIVTGYEGKKLMDYVSTLKISTPVSYVDNPAYASTNNIYSLWLAKDHLLADDTLLFESDLIFDDAIIDKLLENPYPSLALVSKYESWMDGTVVKLDKDGVIEKFIPGTEFSYEECASYYKTVNVYKFSKDFSRTHYVPFLEAYCKALGKNEYYEQVLRVITLLDKPEIKALPLTGESWYEIDDVQDLDIAESIFCHENEKLSRVEKRYGGYWRYPKMLDFCYTDNPYFPNERLMSELKANFERLVRDYPSGMRVNSLLAAKLLGVQHEYVCVGNGITELLREVLSSTPGKVGIMLPTFEEYINRLSPDNVEAFCTADTNFHYTVDDVMQYYATKDIGTLILLNPDNPSGNFISAPDVIRLCTWCKQRGIRLVVDESYIAFADGSPDNSVLTNAVMSAHDNLIILKSISEPYGVPGLRIGVLASGNTGYVQALQTALPIWNINSFGEFYLQILGKYEKAYRESCRHYIEERERVISCLAEVDSLRVIPSQGNYLLCEITGKLSARDLSELLLNRYSILVKECGNKRGLEGRNFIRIALRNRSHNDLLIQALRDLLS